MIAEAANFLATLAVSGRRSRAEINASVRLWARAGRCAKDWADHENHTKSAVRLAMADLGQYRTAVILGSGLLRDVPIDEMAKRFEKVVLVDLQHLASVRFWTMIRGYGNIHFVERDVSGLEQILNGSGNPVDPLQFLNAFGEIDLLVSANLLSQMVLGTLRRLENFRASSKPGMDRADQKSLKSRDVVAALVQTHLSALAAHASTSCLVTDISFEIIDENGKLHQGSDLMHGVKLPDASDNWSWTVAPFGEIEPGYKAVHKVVSIIRSGQT